LARLAERRRVERYQLLTTGLATRPLWCRIGQTHRWRARCRQGSPRISRPGLRTLYPTNEALHPGHVLLVTNAKTSRLLQVVALARISDEPRRGAGIPERDEVVHAVEWPIGLVVVTMVKQRGSTHPVCVSEAAALAPLLRIRPGRAADEPPDHVVVGARAVVGDPVAD